MSLSSYLIILVPNSPSANHGPTHSNITPRLCLNIRLHRGAQWDISRRAFRPAPSLSASPLHGSRQKMYTRVQYPSEYCLDIESLGSHASLRSMLDQPSDRQGGPARHANRAG